MKIAIHNRKGSFSDRWINYCTTNNINHKLVNCLDSDIISIVSDCDAVMWHWANHEASAQIAARQIIYSLEKNGKIVYPDISTCWHYDDKIGQKYLLESINAPIVKTNVFYNHSQSREWINKCKFPKVFKLRKGAGSRSVKLIRSRKKAIRVCNKIFRNGFKAVPGYTVDAVNKIKKTKKQRNYFSKLLRLPRAVLKIRQNNRIFCREIGYLYMQDFLPNNEYDTRITIIGNRAFGFIRYNRARDFRASGSGNIDYDKEKINKDAVKIAFDISKKLKTQSLAFDFLYDTQNNLKIVEMSYAFVSKPIYNCPGFWTPKLEWVNGNYWPEDCIIKDIIKKITEKQ